MIHGGILKDYNFPEDGVDLSVNVNPLGFPESVRDAVISNVDSLFSYPDLYYRQSFANVSQYLNVDEKNIVLGNGSMEIIDLLIQISDRIIISEPCFNEYRRRAEARNKKVLPFNNTSLKKGDMIILGNPNNPDGRLVRDKEKLYGKVRESSAFLVLDETFIEFADKENESIEFFKSFNYKNVAVIRAATKFFALPGLRFGYGVVSESMQKKLKNLQNPWNLNSFVEPISEVIYKDKDYIENSKKLIKKERTFLVNSYKRYKSFSMLPGECNFYLLKIENGKAIDLFNFLFDEGILTRYFRQNELMGEYLRLCIGKRKDNIRLLKALDKFEKR